MGSEFLSERPLKSDDMEVFNAVYQANMEQPPVETYQRLMRAREHYIAKKKDYKAKKEQAKKKAEEDAKKKATEDAKNGSNKGSEKYSKDDSQKVSEKIPKDYLSKGSLFALYDYTSRLLMYHYDMDFGLEEKTDLAKLSMIKGCVQQATKLCGFAWYYPESVNIWGYFKDVDHLLDNHLEFVTAEDPNFVPEEKKVFCSEAREILKRQERLPTQ